MLWWKLVHGILGLLIEQTCQLELDLFTTRSHSWSLPLEQFVRPSSYPIYLPVDFHSITTIQILWGNAKGNCILTLTWNDCHERTPRESGRAAREIEEVESG